MRSQQEILSKVNEVHNNYYSVHPRNMFFKSSQKTECAAMVSNELSIESLMRSTIFIVPNTNKIFFNYCIFKSYANPAIYNLLIKCVLKVLSSCIEKYNSFQIHIDLNTFSVSAAHRYKGFIELFCKECLSSSSQIPIYEHLENFYLYNVPSMIDHISVIFSPFVNDQIRSKIQYVSKKDSGSLLVEFQEQPV
jgi:hypothetical protein